MASIKVGLLVPEDGPAGLWAPSARACANLAIDEINAAGGLLRRPVELVTMDAGTTGASAALAARNAVDIDGVSALIGMFPSYSRESVRDAIGSAVPFIYTPQFEGLERDLEIISTGETSHELLRPAVEWLVQTQGVSRFFLCGSDYIWPHLSFRIAKQLIKNAGGRVVGEEYLPLNGTDFEPVLDAIRKSGCNIVLPHFLGQDAVAFNRAYGEAHLASQAVRLASAVDETVILGLDEDATENLFLASAYFSVVRSRNNGAFLERYHSRFGDRPPPANGYGQSCYEGLYCLAGLVEAAGSLETRRVRAAVGQCRQRKSARGSDAAPITGGRHPIHLARVDGYDIRLMGSL
jgi:urea transport system substrate-binding protein